MYAYENQFQTDTIVNIRAISLGEMAKNNTTAANPVNKRVSKVGGVL